MERTLTILNTFINLEKLEHHRNFLEFCRSADLVPSGLRLKKIASVHGRVPEDFELTWKNVLRTAQNQLLTLLVIYYRDQLEGARENAFDTLGRLRVGLNRDEMDHIRQQLVKSREALERKRISKVERLGKDAGVQLGNLQDLKTTNLYNDDLFDSSDLPVSHEPPRITEGNDISVEAMEETEAVIAEDGRLNGRFVSGNVVNLSRRQLSEAEIQLLSKGLKFSPTPTDIDRAKLKSDMEAYKRRMRLIWHFRNQQDKDGYDNCNTNYKFRPKSTWQPPRNDPVLENYLSLLEKEVLSVSPEGNNFSNLSHSEHLSLQQLKSDRNIVIKEADKGSGIVVWDREDHISEANRQLDDRQVYEEIEVNPTVELGKTINSRVKQLGEEDPGLEEVTDYFKVNDSKLGRLYLLPKIHKGLTSVKGRPVISNCGTITENISEYLDHHLNPSVSQSRSYIKDTNHFLSRLSKLGKIPEGAILCTVDVVGLYPSIPHGEGLEAIREALDRRENPGVATDTLVGLGSLVLENNYFEFNDRIYRQILGTAIGTKFAPAYANLFMTRLEERLLNASDLKPLIWMRFIDDVFFIWMHGKEKLKSFIDHLNSSHDTIKFTSEQSRESISFLDVKVSVGEGGVLSTDLFCKPTDTHQYLHKKSCHPWHTKKAIPYSQALRFRRICSEDRQFQDRVGELAGWLKDRGYEESMVNEQIDRARRLDRQTLLANTGNRSTQGRGKRVPLVATYHPALNSLGKVARRLHPMLTNSEEHREVFPEPPVVAFRRCKNLKDILVRARLYSGGDGGHDKKGCSRCGKSRCQVCSVMSNNSYFHSNVTNREYRINYSFNCNSSNVVYLLECTVCGVQYVGSTNTPFRLRFNNYKSSSRKFTTGASVPQAEFFRHFSGEGHQGFLKDISVKIIDRLTGGDRMRESFWQYRLDSFAPRGLNTRQVDT